MRVRLVCLIAAACTILALTTAPAHAPAHAAGAAPGAPSIKAASAVMVDSSDGRVIFEKEAHRPRAIASTTKIMTALVVIEKAKPTEIVTASANAEAVGADDPLVTELELTAGERLTVEELLYGLLLPSANDAAVALAEHVGGSIEGFAKMMNLQAAKIGATESHFTNPHGLDDPAHFSSAYDLALIARRAMSSPLFRKIVTTRTYELAWPGHDRPRVLQSRNQLLVTYRGAIGIKTGQTKASGHSLVSAAQREGEERIVVVLNSPAVFDESSSLLDHGFRDFRRFVIGSRGRAWGYLTYGDGTTIALMPTRDSSLLIPENSADPEMAYRRRTGVLVVTHDENASQIKLTRSCRAKGCPEIPTAQGSGAIGAVWKILGPLGKLLAPLTV